MPRPKSLMSLADFFDSPNEVLDTTVSGNQIDTTGKVVVTSLRCNISRILVNDTTGRFIGLYEKKSNETSYTLKAIIGLEQNQQYMDVPLSGGSSIKLKAMKNEVIQNGDVCVQFFG